MKNKDTRVQFTLQRLKDSLLELLDKKSINNISVTELCDRAGINRGTFYLHYDTPNDVLLDIENDFIEKNMKEFRSFMSDNHDISFINALIKLMLNDRDTIRILLGKNGNPKFMEKLKNMSREITVNEWNTEFPKYKREKLEFLYEFIFPGQTNLIISWLENDFGISADEFAHRIERIGHYALLSVEEFR